jgi:manganese-dependent inorganic pyrophosphatase
MLLITSYLNPDLDGYACSIAYAEFINRTGKRAVAAMSGLVDVETQFVLNACNTDAIPQITDVTYTNIIILDVSDTIGIDPRLDIKKVVEVIDHRKHHRTHLFPNAKTQIELVGAAATLIAEKYKEANLTPSKESAVLLHAAIASNTINFQSPLTTKRDTAMAEWLQKVSNVDEKFISSMFAAKSNLDGGRLLERMDGDMADDTFNDEKIIITQLEITNSNELIEKRKDEIISILRSLKERERADYSMLSIIDAIQKRNTIVTEDLAEKLTAILDVTFKENVANTTRIVMRKQLWPLLKEHFEKD